MKELLDTLNLRETSSSSIINDNDKNGWMLLPMTMSTNLESSNLGGILTDILRRIRTDLKGGSEGKVMFLGMDLPELPLEEIVASLGLDMAGNPSVDDGVFDTALLCPASDGGYGMLCIPPKAPTDTIFQGIRWSDPLTALSQLKVLSDCHIPIRLGRLMNDIDEPEDVQALCQRISKQQQRGGTVRNDYYPEEDNDALTKSAPGSSTAQTGSCRYTIKALTELGLLFTKQKS